MNNITVLRTERDGVEFFTIVATGESGMSQRGLARACGKALSTVQNLVKNLTDGKPPKRLERFKGMDLNLTDEIEKNGGDVIAYKAEFCSAIIKHYARLGSERAQDTDDLIGEIGLTSYIQSITGWLPEEFKAAPEAHKKLDQFLSLAMEWDRGVMMVVDDEGYEVDMSDSWTFFDAVVFSGFTVEEFIQFEDETVKLGLQKHSKSEKVKLFFERNPEIAERQKPHTENLERMLRLPKSPQLFRMTFFEEFGCEPDEIYWDLVQSALDSRIYAIGYADRAKRTEPLNPRIDSYMRGWNANTSASLVNK